MNGNYSFAKTNFTANKDEKKVLLDDPDFWKKVFKDSEKPTTLILKEIDQKIENGMFKLLIAQKELVLKLAEEVHSYLINRVKNDEFSPETEGSFEEVFQKFLDNPDTYRPVEEVVHQLQKDLIKKSRRIKLVDEKHFKLLQKKKKEQNDSKKTKKENESNAESNEGDNIVLSDPDYSDANLAKNGKTRKATCFVCKLEKPNLICKSHCKNSYHKECLTKLIEKNLLKIKTILKDENISLEQIEVVVDKECFFCIHRIAMCFDCKDFGMIEENGKINQAKEDNDSNFVYKCKECP